MAEDRISLDHKDRLDEIVAFGGAHLEYLGGGQWFAEFIYSNGDSTVVRFSSKSLRRAEREARKST